MHKEVSTENYSCPKCGVSFAVNNEKETCFKNVCNECKKLKDANNYKRSAE